MEPPTKHFATVILITGHPATGKTTLGRTLAERLRLPLICKDYLKETLSDVLGVSTDVWSRELSKASWALLYRQSQVFLQAAVDFIVESNFDPRYADKQWQRLAQQFPIRFIQIRCETDAETLLLRYEERIQRGERHLGHVDDSGNRQQTVWKEL